MVAYDVVVPSIGRPSLGRLLVALARQPGPPPCRVLLVDDRRAAGTPLVELDEPPDFPVEILQGPAAGPAAARNAGWRATSEPWVVFLDDDVVPTSTWRRDLATDLDGARAAGSQGRIRVPLPAHRRPTDWERNVAGLEQARWATADMAYRRDVLERVGGFDERFPRAYREDADLALRVMSAGGRLVVGSRAIDHPVRPAPWWISVALQRGNADDVLMRRIHGPHWRDAADAPRGGLHRHVATTAAAIGALGATAMGAAVPAMGAAAIWAVLTASFAARRIAPGPRTASEVAAMAATSAAIPPVATWHHVAGRLRARSANVTPTRRAPAAVLFDRDGTLIRDVAYNGDPANVDPMPSARAAVARVRAAGVPIGVVSNQSGIARGLLTADQVERVNQRVDELLGPFDTWHVCPHGVDDDCTCRKPAPGLVIAAARRLGVAPSDCAVVGDIGSDVDAARQAGARGILVPTATTRTEEVEAADEVAPDLVAAVERLLGPAS